MWRNKRMLHGKASGDGDIWLKEIFWGIQGTHILMSCHSCSVHNSDLWKKQLIPMDGAFPCCIRLWLCSTLVSPWVWTSWLTWHLLWTDDSRHWECFTKVIFVTTWTRTVVQDVPLSCPYSRRGFVDVWHSINLWVFCIVRKSTRNLHRPYKPLGIKKKITYQLPGQLWMASPKQSLWNQNGFSLQWSDRNLLELWLPHRSTSAFGCQTHNNKQTNQTNNKTKNQNKQTKILDFPVGY